VIVMFNGKEVSSMRGLPRIVAQTPIGKTVAVEVRRDQKPVSLSVKVGEQVEKEEGLAGTAEPDGDPSDTDGELAPVLGMTLSELTDELRAQYSIDANVEGVVVTDVQPESVAANKKIKAGDVIVEAAQEQVRTPKEIADRIERAQLEGQNAVLLRIEGKRGELRFEALPVR
jgi:serine protease Do